MATIQERVEAGIEFLNQKRPGWFNEVDLKNLDMGSPCRCVLGQLYGRFSLEQLKGLDADQYTWEPAIPFGFLAHTDFNQAKVGQEYAALDEEWMKQIQRLQEGDVIAKGNEEEVADESLWNELLEANMEHDEAWRQARAESAVLAQTMTVG